MSNTKTETHQEYRNRILKNVPVSKLCYVCYADSTETRHTVLVKHPNYTKIEIKMQPGRKGRTKYYA